MEEKEIIEKESEKVGDKSAYKRAKAKTWIISAVFVAIFAVAFMTMHPALGGTIIAAGVICLLVAWGLCLKIEHIAGYYECPRCEARYVPKFKDMCFSMHFGRTRKMKCPHCGRKSWHEKVLTNNTEN